MVKAAGTDEIKKELQQLPPKKLVELVLRLARFKKENKELLSYILFEAGDTAGYIQSVLLMISESFATLEGQRVHDQKKSVRRILRLINRQAKYIGTKEAHAEMLQHFCTRLTETFYPKMPSVLATIYRQQIEKITKLLPSIDEDLRHDYEKWMRILEVQEKKPAGSSRKQWWVFGKTKT